MSRRGGPIKKWTWYRRATALAFLVLLILGARDWFPWFRGSTAGTKLLNFIPLTDPLAALEVTLATRSFHPTMLTGAAILVVVCAVFGPIFCGWVCPLGLILDLNDGVRRRLLATVSGKPRVRRPERKLPRSLRYGVLGLVLGFALVGGVPAFQTLSPINLVSWSFVFFPEPALAADAGLWDKVLIGLRSVWAAGGMLLIALAVIVALEYVFPRLWCRTLCPLGALYSFIGRLAPLRIRVDQGQAGKARCELCAYHCPMGIEVMRDYTLAGKSSIDDADCTRCGGCIDSCPRGVLRLGFYGTPGDSDSGGVCSRGEEAPAGTEAAGLHNPLDVIQPKSNS